MKEKSEKKTSRFHLRTTRNGRANIATLAKRLGVKESEAVRQAVALALETHMLPTRDLRLSPRKTAARSAAMIAQAN